MQDFVSAIVPCEVVVDGRRYLVERPTRTYDLLLATFELNAGHLFS